ncbi:hypothetical protein [Lacrimispora sp.]|uniref:hypothetical protein n=1 Tax=Lacrimispora sp. TaxID=2719234 RepID=UPI002FD8D4E7
MKKYDNALFLIHLIIIASVISFLFIIILGKGESKWQIGAIELCIALVIIGLIVLWIQGREIKDSMKVIEKFQ